MEMPLNLVRFRQDAIACLRYPRRPFQAAKAFAILLLDRWNDHFPVRWQPNVQFSIMHHGRPINVDVSFANQHYTCFREIFFEGVYDQPLGNPATILDLGANCGFATLLFAARYPKARIAAVEPHPSNLAALRENLKLNNVRAEVIGAAATIIDGPVDLMIRTSMSHGLIHRNHRKVEGHLTVPGISISTLLTQLGWDRIDLLKVDMEGYERVLLGGHPAWLNRVTRIIGEHHDDYGILQLQADLEPMGFIVDALPHANLFLAVRRGSSGGD